MSRMSELDLERSNVLNFVTDGKLDSILDRRQRREEGLRECFRRDADHAADYAENAMDHCRAMHIAGFDTTRDLEQIEEWAASFLEAVRFAKAKKWTCVTLNQTERTSK